MGLVIAEQTFDDYKVIKINVTTNKQVELLNQMAKDPDHVSRFKREAQINILCTKATFFKRFVMIILTKIRKKFVLIISAIR